MRRADAPRASSAGEEGGARCRRGDDRRGGGTRWDEVTPRRMDRVDDGRGSILSSVSNTLDVISLSLSLSLSRTGAATLLLSCVYGEQRGAMAWGASTVF
jgi:hypothetical protein